MTNYDVRKLLGGYATNTLTETERKVLFDAALEDQELFNALQDEQALKELLADPVSRAQVQRALREPASAWWTRWWAWSGAVSAVAAGVLIVAVIRSDEQPKPVLLNAAKAPTVQPAPASGTVKKQEAFAPKLAREADRDAEVRTTRANKPLADSLAKSAKDSAPVARDERKDEVASTTPPPAARVLNATPASAPAPPPSTAQQMQSAVEVNGALGGPSQNAIQNQNQSQNSFRAAPGTLSGFVAKEQVALRYSLVKLEANGSYLQVPSGVDLKTGDAIRLSVSPSLPGFLSLDRLEASGGWKRVFPQTGPGIVVAANTSYSIPDSSLTVADKDQQLRIILAPFGAVADSVAVQAEAGARRKAAKRDTKKTIAEPEEKMSAARTTVIVNLTIGPKKAP